MEIPVIVGLLGLGYYYNKLEEDKNKTNDEINEPKNIYESKRAQEIRKKEFETSAKVWSEENRIMPGPPKIDPKLLFNKVDYEDNKLPVEFENYDKNDIYTDVKINSIPNNPINMYSTNSPVSGGEEGISLTGLPINRTNFKHNNMVPFFGGRVKQNVDDKANMSKLETFTGQVDNYQDKKEIGPLFQAETNVTNVYGSANHTQYLYDRIVPSKVMNNVSPIEKVRVGPGINQGYTAQPSGGYQQANARDYVMPKTVDELRVKNNPRLTYYGRVLSGMKTARPAVPGKVQKLRPERFYDNTPERYFTTTGAYLAPKQRGGIVMKDGNRRTTVLKRRLGPAGTTSGNRDNIRPESRKSKKLQFKTDGPRHVNATGRWNMDGGEYFVDKSGNMQLRKESIEEAEARQALHDYGKSRTQVRDTIREDTAPNCYKGPLKDGDLGEARNDQDARETKKKFTEDGDHVRNVNAGVKKQYVYDPEDIARTTIKEQFVDNTHEGFVDIGSNKKGYVHDPNDLPRTTMKETLVDDGRVGIVSGQIGNMRIRNGQKAKTTTKETTILEDVMGGIYKALGMGYDVTKNEIRNTVRQFTGDTNYMGGANSKDKRGETREAMGNTTTRSLREQVSRGREPTLSGKKQFNNRVNVTTKKLGDIQNRYYNERGLMPTKVYNSLPQQNNCGETKDKTTVPNEPLQDRLDPHLLDQLKDNPYSMRSLSSA